MKRFIVFLLAVFLLAGIVPTLAQDAPSAEFLGTWPYVLKPDHNLNSFTPNGPTANLGTIFWQMVEMPPAFLHWATGEYEGLLAESWGFVDDNKAYQIVLKDAKWSDGSAVTADDVVATYALGKVSGFLTAVFPYINEVQKVDDKTVKFIFSGEPSLLAERLILKQNISAAATYGDLVKQAEDLIASGKTKDDQEWIDLSKAITDFRPEALLATGPYTYTLDDVGDSFMTLKWQPNSIFSSTVKFGSIKLWAGETDVSTPLVLSGDIAWATNVYPAATQQAFKDAGIRLLIKPRGYGPALLMNHDVWPFSIKEVRQAMAYAINRDDNAFLTNGFGATGTMYMAGILDSMVPNLLSQDAIDKLNHYEFNVDKAAELMTAAGFTKNADGKWADADGKTISVEYKFPAEFADFAGASQNAIEQLNNFGFDITARALPWQQVPQDIYKGDFQMSVWSWASGSPFAGTQFRGPLFRFNYPGLAEGQPGMDFKMEFDWNGESVNLVDMINGINVGLDTAAQQERAGKVAIIINDEMPFIPLNVILSTEPWNDKILAGGPADDDPILQNPSTDDFVVLWLLNGTIAPAAS